MSRSNDSDQLGLRLFVDKKPGTPRLSHLLHIFGTRHQTYEDNLDARVQRLEFFRRS
jgi:hypothetical protein